MTWRLTLCATLAVALLLGLPRVALADHPPECAWEMGGTTELHPARCLLTHPLPSTAQTVTVSNFPATQPVSGTVSVNEPVTVDGTVTADHGAGWPTSGTEPASSVVVENVEALTVPTGTALGLLLFVSVATFIAGLRRNS